MSGIGWALGMERLLIALEAEGIELEQKPALDAYVMCLDKEARTYAFEVLTELRAYGYRCDMDMMERSFKAQFKAVDRSKAKLAILIGKSELEEKKVTVKNIAHKEQESIEVEKLIPYVDSVLEEESHHHHEHEGE